MTSTVTYYRSILTVLRFIYGDLELLLGFQTLTAGAILMTDLLLPTTSILTVALWFMCGDFVLLVQ
jgi:hypothetical protein